MFFIKNLLPVIIVQLLFQTIILSQDIQTNEKEIFIKVESGKIYGSLLLPEGRKKSTVVMIISGSGPTDRDGNNEMMKNNSLKLLAEGLAQKGIGSLRYDKRGIGKSREAIVSTQETVFGDFVADAGQWIKKLQSLKSVENVFIAGHSEGSLIGIIAAQKHSVSGFISIAGAGKRADLIIEEQLKEQSAKLAVEARGIMDSLISGYTVEKVSPQLSGIFNTSTQPYIISWFKYDPSTEIKKLNIPILIIQGLTDMQVKQEDAELLYQARKDLEPDSELLLIEKMNHVLKESEADRFSNLMTYSNPKLPVVPELYEAIEKFILSISK